MKRKNILVGVSFILIIVLIGVLFYFLNGDSEEENYEIVYLDFSDVVADLQYCDGYFSENTSRNYGMCEVDETGYPSYFSESLPSLKEIEKLKLFGNKKAFVCGNAFYNWCGYADRIGDCDLVWELSYSTIINKKMKHEFSFYNCNGNYFITYAEGVTGTLHGKNYLLVLDENSKQDFIPPFLQ